MSGRGGASNDRKTQYSKLQQRSRRGGVVVRESGVAHPGVSAGCKRGKAEEGIDRDGTSAGAAISFVDRTAFLRRTGESSRSGSTARDGGCDMGARPAPSGVRPRRGTGTPEGGVMKYAVIQPQAGNGLPCRDSPSATPPASTASRVAYKPPSQAQFART